MLAFILISTFFFQFSIASKEGSDMFDMIASLFLLMPRSQPHIRQQQPHATAIDCPALITLPTAHHTYLVERLAKDYDYDTVYSHELIDEFRKFFSLALAGVRGSPSPLVDQVWHSYILHTQFYADVCRQLARNGRFVHHVPFFSGNQQLKRRSTHMFPRVQRCFGANVDVWLHGSVLSNQTADCDSDCESRCQGHCGPHDCGNFGCDRDCDADNCVGNDD